MWLGGKPITIASMTNKDAMRNSLLVAFLAVVIGVLIARAFWHRHGYWSSKEYRKQLREQQRRKSGGYRYFMRRLRCIQDGGYKFIWASDGSHKLYYLPENPDELNDLMLTEPQRATRLNEKLQTWLGTVESSSPAAAAKWPVGGTVR